MLNDTQAGTHYVRRRSRRRTIAACTLVAVSLFLAVAQSHADQLTVTAANWLGNAVYDLSISPSGATPSTPAIGAATLGINSSTDARKHGNFDALAWVPNSYCKSLDLLVADATNHQIVRYQGAASITAPGCYNPTNGTPTVSPTAQSVFSFGGTGPEFPNALSADAHGNVFLVSSGCTRNSKAGVWALPFNAANGQFGAPILIDAKFGGVATTALIETLVAGYGAATSLGNTLWHAGDLLVLVGDLGNNRLVVYSQSKLYGLNTNGTLNTSGLPLSGPTSVAIPNSLFAALKPMPGSFLSALESSLFGMDLLPATPPSTDTNVLFTTGDGRIVRFDTAQDKFVSNYASGLGIGLQKLKVGLYSDVPYAFVAQVLTGNKWLGQVRVLGSPNSNGSNNQLGSVTSGVMEPVGIAIASSGSQALPPPPSGSTNPCPPNNPCVIAPLGTNVITTTIADFGSGNISGTVQETLCTVLTDPRVTATLNGNTLTSWSCTGTDLPIGAGTNYCPSFPSGYIPGSVCGHSGPTASGFVVMEGTATGLDPFDNNSILTTAANVDSVLPGPANLECNTFGTTGQIPLMAWGPRSDLPTIEGVIPEDSQFGPSLGGAPGFLMESTSACDASQSGVRGISLLAFGVGLSTPPQSTGYQTYLYGLLTEKFAAVTQTVTNANITSAVQSQLQTDISDAQFFVSEAQNGGNLTSNIDCALSQIYATDVYLRGNLPAFSSNLIQTLPGGGNPNPAGDIDGRLANLYMTLNTELLGNAPPTPPAPPAFPIPAASVPSCTLSPPPYFVGGVVSGLAASSVVTLLDQDNSDVLLVVGSGSGSDAFAFPADLGSGAAYSITVSGQPANETCAPSGGASGTISEGNVTNVAISCTSSAVPPSIQTFTVVPNPNVTNGLLFAWTTSNATSCNLSDANGNLASQSTPTYPITNLAANDSVQFLADDAATGVDTDSYTLTCVGAVGPNATNTVAYPPEPTIVTFTIGPFGAYPDGVDTVGGGSATYCLLSGLMEGGYWEQFGEPGANIYEGDSPARQRAWLWQRHLGADVLWTCRDNAGHAVGSGYDRVWERDTHPHAAAPVHQ
jgi:hypothetical protein